MLFFIFYRKKYIFYSMYKNLLPLFSKEEREQFIKNIQNHNLKMREKTCVENKVYLDTILGENIYLEESQRHVIVSEAEAILIQAGAGSGKSTTLLSKIKYIVEVKGISPSSIALISYTNETVNELKDKLHKKYHLPISVFTFHTFALSLIQNNKQVLVNRTSVIEQCLESLFIDEKTKKVCYKAFSTFLNRISILLLIFPFLIYKKYFCKQNKFCSLQLLSYLDKKIGEIEVNESPENYFLVQKRSNDKDRKVLQRIAGLELVFWKYRTHINKNNLIDFEGMIKEAINTVQKKEIFEHTFTYLLIDEYQDISYHRFWLIYQYITKCHCNIIVVGDDFQSIFAFSGSRIDLFTNFTYYFKGAEVYTIQMTYRNSQSLIRIAGNFIAKNPEQIAKKLRSSKQEKFPIVLGYYKENMESIFEKCLLQILYELGENVEILVLGRYRFDIDFLRKSNKFKIINNQIIYKNFSDVYIIFHTIHSSKGLGFDSVILLNAKSGKYGFPTRRCENDESYPYAEERRLFYVALTRTKNKIYILVPKINPSIFIREILTENMEQIICMNS